ncbi:MAG: hypothetical protein ACRDS0_11590 [Pseudonocardiaceae bacterium]
MRFSPADTLDPAECSAEHVPDLTLPASLTETGHTRYVRLSAPPHRTPPRIPDPQFPTKTVLFSTPPAGTEHASLPVRSPGAHLHPLLRRPPLLDRCTERGDSR